ncbi:MAG: hypothetical protein GY940_06160 [bacterium]|nr:hypothetical protein [bacterium]
MKTRRLSRTQFNRLLSIPEAKEIYDAQMLQLKLLFKDRLEESVEPEPDSSNIILLPMRSHRDPNAGHNARSATVSIRQNRQENLENITHTRIVDTGGYRGEREEEQIQIFLDYFDHSPAIRKIILDNFFLRILPYVSAEVE